MSIRYFLCNRWCWSKWVHGTQSFLFKIEFCNWHLYIIIILIKLIKIFEFSKFHFRPCDPIRPCAPNMCKNVAFLPNLAKLEFSVFFDSWFFGLKHPLSRKLLLLKSETWSPKITNAHTPNLSRSNFLDSNFFFISRSNLHHIKGLVFLRTMVKI
jgi:hypothetical protein